VNRVVVGFFNAERGGTCDGIVINDAVTSPGVVNAGAAIADDFIVNTHAVCTLASGAPAIAWAPDDMEVVAEGAIIGDVVTTVVDAANVVSGANGVAAADVRQGEGVTAVRVALPSTQCANSVAIVNGRLGVDVAGSDRVSFVNVFEDVQDSAVFEDVQDSAVNRDAVFPYHFS